MPSLEQLRAAVQAGPPYTAELLAQLDADPRAGARMLAAQCKRRQQKRAALEGMARKMSHFENEAWQNGFRRIAGVDEAGRGPLAGPIVAAAVLLHKPLAGLNDSKQLSPEQRLRLFDELHSAAEAIGVSEVWPPELDQLGVQAANYRAMLEAVLQIAPPPDFLLVDGYQIPGCELPHKRIVKGDTLSLSIAAASIVAKVTRDRLMDGLDAMYPEYGFARNKGYGTREHLEALRKRGPCPIHRLSFAPCRENAPPLSLFGDSC